MMDGKLQFLLEPKEHPFPEEPSATKEAWGQVLVQYINDEGRKDLLSWEWDILTLAEWFVENKGILCNKSSSFANIKQIPHNDESLAEWLWHSQSQEIENNDDWYESLYEFRRSHSLRFALRGANIPDIIIGQNHGYGEISFCDGNVSWKYNFNIDVFCQSLQRNLLIFLGDVTRNSSKSENIDYIKNIIVKLT